MLGLKPQSSTTRPLTTRRPTADPVVCETRCDAACVAPCGAPLGWLHQRSGESACPASFPRDLVCHVLWDIACAGTGELWDRVHPFLAPSSARLDGDDDQSAPLGCDQLWVTRFLDMPCSLLHSTVPLPRLHCKTKETSTRKCAHPTRKILGEDLHTTLLKSSNVHVAEISVVSHLSARLQEDEWRTWRHIIDFVLCTSVQVPEFPSLSLRDFSRPNKTNYRCFTLV